MKNRKKTNSKKIYLPLSILVPYSIILFTLSALLIFFGLLLSKHVEEFFYWQTLSFETLLILFFCVLFIVIILLTVLLRMNERLRSRDDIAKPSNSKTTQYSKLTSDRSYLENQISEISDIMLSSPERWQEINHLILSSRNYDNNINRGVSSKEFLKRHNLNFEEIKIDRNYIFVLTPFHEKYLKEYLIIKHTCEDEGFITERSDERIINGDILSHIISCIIKSKILIVNINGRNPNVFYELGIAHALNKPTIIVSHADNMIPFDIQSQFVIIYQNNKELEKKLQKLLNNIKEDENFKYH